MIDASTRLHHADQLPMTKGCLAAAALLADFSPAATHAASASIHVLPSLGASTVYFQAPANSSPFMETPFMLALTFANRI